VHRHDPRRRPAARVADLRRQAPQPRRRRRHAQEERADPHRTQRCQGIRPAQGPRCAVVTRRDAALRQTARRGVQLICPNNAIHTSLYRVVATGTRIASSRGMSTENRDIALLASALIVLGGAIALRLAGLHGYAVTNIAFWPPLFVARRTGEAAAAAIG